MAQKPSNFQTWKEWDFLLSKTIYWVGQESADCQNRSEIFKILLVRSDILKPFGSGPTGFDPWIPVAAWDSSLESVKNLKQQREDAIFELLEFANRMITVEQRLESFKNANWAYSDESPCNINALANAGWFYYPKSQW